MRYIVYFLSFFLFSAAGLAQTVDLEPIVVMSDPASQRSQSVITGKYLRTVPARSVEEALRYIPGVELRRRNTFGVQQDISLRGSSFEDVFVSIDDIGLNDPQTGHFSAEIPFTPYDIERVAVDKGRHTVDYRIKKPKNKGGVVEISFGEHALFTEGLSVNFGNDTVRNRVSIDHRSSSGGRADTDFDNYRFSAYSVLGDPENEFSLLLGSLQKQFGASTFYSVNFPHQYEEISQRLVKFGHHAEIDDTLTFDTNLYFRRHGDHFLLDRHNPSFYGNDHTTYVYGGGTEVSFWDSFEFDADIAREKITSTSLGNHSRIRKSFELSWSGRPAEYLVLQASTGAIHYQGYGLNQAWHAKLGIVPSKRLEFDIIFDRIFRYPSFTELFYNSPANVGNSSLDPEKVDNVEFMASFSGDIIRFHSGIFLKQYRDTIDWVKNTAAGPWQARNAGKFQTKGIECGLGFKIDNTIIKKIHTDYTYIHSSSPPYSFSKYLFDYDKHRLTAGLELSVFSADVNIFTHLVRPYQRRNYVACDVKISKDINDDFSVFLEGTNIFNRGYYELAEVKAQGRWWRMGAEYRF